MHVQFKNADDSWSEWTIAELEGTSVKAAGIVVKNFPIRVLHNNDVSNPEVFWYDSFEEKLYKINAIRNFISKGVSIDTDIDKKDIASFGQAEEYTLQNLNNIKASASKFLKEQALPLFTLLFLQDNAFQFIEEGNIRPPDAAQTIRLVGGEQAEDMSKTWWEELYGKYKKNVYDKLTTIINETRSRGEQNRALLKFLDDNYKFVQGTCLDYVAIPDNVVTKKLITIAETIAKDTDAAAITLLMPGIATENATNNETYGNLTELDLSKVLRSHIYLKPGFLAPVRYLAEYIQSPTDKHYCPYVGNVENSVGSYAEFSDSDIQALFEHSQATQELCDAYKQYDSLLTNKSNLLGQLNLLVRQLKLYDAHGGTGKQDNAAGGAYPAIISFMQYYQDLEQCVLIKDTEPSIANLPEEINIGYVFYNEQLYFLNRHKNEVKAVTNSGQKAKFKVIFRRQSMDLLQNKEIVNKHYTEPTIIKYESSTDPDNYVFFPGDCPLDKSLFDDTTNFFPKDIGSCFHYPKSNIPSELSTAIDEIYHTPLFASIFSEKFPQGGKLSLENLYWIENQTSHSFMEGYTRVPEDIHNEIKLLFDLCSNETLNTNATQNIATCIGTRREELERAIQGKENILIQISLSAQEFSTHLEKAEKNLRQLSSSLIKSLDDDSYTGYDHHLNLDACIITSFSSPITIQRESDAKVLNYFKQEDLSTLLACNQPLVTSLERVLAENYLIEYIFDTPDNTLSAILPHIKKNLSYFFSVEGFFNLISPTKLNIILENISIENHSLFMELFQELTGEKKQQLLQFFQDTWFDIIYTASDFTDLYQILAEEDKKKLFNFFEHKQWRDTNREKDLIDSLENFSTIYQKLSVEEHKEKLFAQLVRKNIMTSIAGFINTYQKLEIENKNKFFNLYKDKFAQIFMGLDSFLDLYTILESDDQNELFKILHSMIENNNNFLDNDKTYHNKDLKNLKEKLSNEHFTEYTKKLCEKKQPGDKSSPPLLKPLTFHLNAYKKNRLILSTKQYTSFFGWLSRLFGAYSRDEKFAAVEDLIACLEAPGRSLEQKHLGPLKQGKLKKILENQNVSIDENFRPTIHKHHK